MLEPDSSNISTNIKKRKTRMASILKEKVQEKKKKRKKDGQGSKQMDKHQEEDRIQYGWMYYVSNGQRKLKIHSRYPSLRRGHKIIVIKYFVFYFFLSFSFTYFFVFHCFFLSLSSILIYMLWFQYFFLSLLSRELW